MALTPIASLSIATGMSQNVTVVDQNGNALPDGSITFQGVNHFTFAQDQVLGGFTFTAVTAGSDSILATHGPSGHTATLPATATNPVTGIGFATAS